VFDREWLYESKSVMRGRCLHAPRMKAAGRSIRDAAWHHAFGTGMTRGSAVLVVEEGWWKSTGGLRRRCGSRLSKTPAGHWRWIDTFNFGTTKTQL